MELSVKSQLEKEPNLWIRKTLTVLFVIAIMLWAAKSIAFTGVKENGVDIAKNVLSGILHPDVDMLLDFKAGVPYLTVRNSLYSTTRNHNRNYFSSTTFIYGF